MEIHLDQPLILGAGVQGLLIYRNLKLQGFSPLIVDKGEIAGGQTAHSHGWLHSGSIYNEADKVSIREFRLALDWWKEEIRLCGYTPTSYHSLIAVTDANERTRLIKRWRENGVNYEKSHMEVTNTYDSFRTDEWGVEPVKLLKFLFRDLKIDFLKLEVQGIDFRSDIPTVSGVSARLGEIILTTPFIVNCLGNGISKVAGNNSSRFLSRKSMMYVVQYSRQRYGNFSIPTKAANGVFGVERRYGDGYRLILSTNISYGNMQGGSLESIFGHQNIFSLASRYFPSLLDQSNSWGYYEALKTDVHLNDQLGQPVPTVIRNGSRMLDVSPGKFTLAPIVADKVINVVGEYVNAKRSEYTFVEEECSWAREDHTFVPMMTPTTFFGVKR